jgi:hypothetical protein
MVQVCKPQKIEYNRDVSKAHAEGNRFQVRTTNIGRNTCFEVVDTTRPKCANALFQYFGPRSMASANARDRCDVMNKRCLISGTVSRPATPGPSVDASANALATDVAAS